MRKLGLRLFNFKKSNVEFNFESIEKRRAGLIFFAPGIYLTALLVLTACGSWSSLNEEDPQPPGSSQNSPIAVPTMDPNEDPEEPSDDPLTNNQNVQSEDKKMDATSRAKSSVQNDDNLLPPDGLILEEGETESDFVTWIGSPENNKALAQLGTLNGETRTLALNTDATLSFSSFAAQRPFLIKTFGHNITLVSADFGYLKIDTSTADGNSGHVRIYSTAPTLPSINTAAGQGQSGADGHCTDGTNCISVSETSTNLNLQQSGIQWVPQEIERWWDWSDPSIPQQWRDKVVANVRGITANAFSSSCTNGEPSQIRIQGPFIEGKLRIIQHLEHPVLMANSSQPNPIDAVLFAGHAGSDGFHGGEVNVFQFKEESRDWIKSLTTQGGFGGIGGLNFKSPASAALSEQQLSTQKKSEIFLFDQLKAQMSAQYRCPGYIDVERSGSRLVSEKFDISFLEKTVPVDTGIVFDNKNLFIQGVAPGRDDYANAPQRAASGAKGRDGQIKILRSQNPDDWTAKIHSRIPIPKKCLN